MKIIKHRLVKSDSKAYPYSESPNFGAKMKPEYLVMHYTAGRSAKESITWLCNRNAKASAHLVIGRDGEITQLVPFDTCAWHAGESRWEGKTGLNRCSIGIELDNAGRLTRHGSRWRAWFGTEFDEKDVLEATHKNETSAVGWQLYTPEQLDAALELSLLLVQQYGLRDIMGHEDISPGRKSDPGPAFPIASFRSRLYGRQEDQLPTYRTTAELNIRSGPGTQHDLIPGSPLPKGARVEVLREQESWRLVDVLDTVKGVMDMQGWVHHRFLERAS
jgi:N-acetylmuramoyl-L-alanine amidase